jgi:hypothetical protein
MRGSPLKRRQRAYALVLGLVAWALLARFVWLDHNRGDRQLALSTGSLAFVAYLVEIGYVIYLRVYASTPQPNDPAWSKPRVGPLATWLATIAALAAFGLSIGFVFPDLPRSFAGSLFVQTVTFGGVAAGLIFAMTGLPHLRRHRELATPIEAAAPPLHPPPPFWLVALKVIAWQIGSVAIAGLLFGPVLLLQREFDRWIDIPACQRVCAAHGLAFESFASGKSFYNCTCVGAVFHDRAYVTGGHSWGACGVDWMFRAGTSLAVAIGWPIALITLAVFVMARRKGRKIR